MAQWSVSTTRPQAQRAVGDRGGPEMFDEVASPRLAVRRMGQAGPALILLHGLGASGRSWRLVAERLRERARILCPDLLGFGRSPRPRLAYTLTDHLAALDRTFGPLLGREPVLLAGHSTGAVLALAWAATRPERFRAVALLSLPAYRSAAEARACIASLSPLAWATVARPDLGGLACGVMCAARPFWRAIMPLVTPGVPADIARDYVLHDWVSYSGTLDHVLVRRRVAPVATRLVATGMPVRLLHGAGDRAAPVAAVRELAARHGWPLTLLPGQGHHLPLTAPDACARMLAHMIAGEAAIDSPLWSGAGVYSSSISGEPDNSVMP